MATSKSRLSWPLPRGPWLGLFASILTGCAMAQSHIDRALVERRRTTEQQPIASYLVGCPDVLDVTFAGQPGLSGRRALGPDGCVDLANRGRVRVEGQTVAEVARRLADAAGVPANSVQVRVAEYNSQQVYLLGQIVGLQRAVPYQGPETVLDLLRRAGGLTPGAAPDEVYVVRSRVAEGKQPEVFRVDLHAIVLGNDQRTNIRIQPLDQVFVGETKQCSFAKCMPPWLRPLYEMVCGLRRAAGGQDDKVTE